MEAARASIMQKLSLPQTAEKLFFPTCLDQKHKDQKWNQFIFSFMIDNHLQRWESLKQSLFKQFVTNWRRAINGSWILMLVQIFWVHADPRTLVLPMHFKALHIFYTRSCRFWDPLDPADSGSVSFFILISSLDMPEFFVNLYEG